MPVIYVVAGPIFPNTTASQILISIGKAVATVQATIKSVNFENASEILTHLF